MRRGTEPRGLTLAERKRRLVRDELQAVAIPEAVKAVIAGALARRAGLPEPNPRLHFAAGLGLLAYSGALKNWAEADGQSDPAEIINTAFAEAGKAFSHPPPTAAR